MSFLYPAVDGKGFRTIVEPGKSHLRLLSFGLLSLEAGEEWEKKLEGVEGALVILGGKCAIEADKQRWSEVGERKDVFSGRASTVYVPSGGRLKVKALGKLEAALLTAPASNKGEAILIKPEDVIVQTRGRGNWQRSVQDIIDRRVPAQRLIVGETYNDPGAWSGYPPHKHDEDIPGEEVTMEEVYHFRLNPAQGFGFQRIYSPARGLDEAYVLQNGVSIAIPFGYHPVVAGAGYQLYFLWALAGETRDMKPHDDPAHIWVHELKG